MGTCPASDPSGFVSTIHQRERSMKLRLGVTAMAVALACAWPASARASTFSLDSIPHLGSPFGQCHNEKGCGGIQIDWDGLGFQAGNPHGALHLNNLTIGMSTQAGTFG